MLAAFPNTWTSHLSEQSWQSSSSPSTSRWAKASLPSNGRHKPWSTCDDGRMGKHISQNQYTSAKILHKSLWVSKNCTSLWVSKRTVGPNIRENKQKPDTHAHACTHRPTTRLPPPPPASPSATLIGRHPHSYRNGLRLVILNSRSLITLYPSRAKRMMLCACRLRVLILML